VPPVRRLPLLAFGLVLTGFNLRIAVASIPPLLSDLERDPGMSTTVAGLLTSLPVLCFGALALAGPSLVRRAGSDATLVLALAGIACGVALRGAGSTGALFAGTALAGAGIAVGNVVVPALIKGRFPARVGLLMGVYTAVLAAGAALAGGISVPLERALGWRGALALWAAPAVVALVTVALPVLRGRRDRAVRGGSGDVRTLLRDPLAWQVTVFFGIQSAVFYSGLAWLPSILRDQGYSAATAGALLSVYALGGIPASLTAPVIAVRLRDQRSLAVGAVVLEAAAAAGLAALPSADPAWVVLYALGQGAAFSLALTLIVLRSPDARRGAELSGMVQAIGYCLAATGPFAVGALHDARGGWTAPLLLLLALCLPMATAGVGAGRARLVSASSAHGVPVVP
jgi:CP family cyanate transporter-like MFS transporter